MRRTLLTAAMAFTLLSCTGTRPTDLGVNDTRLADCPSSPNCVSSDEDPGDEEHYIEALQIAGDPAAYWAQVREAVLALPRTEITDESDTYIRAESTSRIFRFVDDVELHLRPDEGIVAVRSASRIGRSDWGVNRDRVEAIRSHIAGE